MTPTRVQIQEKLTEVNGDYTAMATWLDDVECPEDAKLKILDDLGSYE